MAIIKELSSHLADLIAAGEVVERPASVAKELVENAIDAGSNRITVEIENGGITYLRIADNGCGMAPEDAPVAFRRHATSKLRSEEDLADLVRHTDRSVYAPEGSNRRRSSASGSRRDTGKRRGRLPGGYDDCCSRSLL